MLLFLEEQVGMREVIQPGIRTYPGSGLMKI